MTIAEICKAYNLSIHSAKSILLAMQDKGMVRGFDVNNSTAKIELSVAARQYFEDEDAFNA